MRQWIRKYSWTPSWTVNLKILLDIRVTVTFQRAFQPSAGLSYWKIGTRQMCMKWLLIIRHVNSVEQCRTVSTVSTVSIVSTVSSVIARCYLHLRWYFLMAILPSSKYVIVCLNINDINYINNINNNGHLVPPPLPFCILSKLLTWAANN